MFLALEFTAGALRSGASDVYNRLKFRDEEMVSTLLFSKEDKRDILAVEGVKDLECSYSQDAAIAGTEKDTPVTVQSLTVRTNLCEVVEGRLPESVFECAVEQFLADQLGLSLGETLKIVVKDSAPNYLAQTEFTIVGIVNHPDYLVYSAPGNRYVLVEKEAFDLVRLDGAFMKAELLFETKAKDRYSNAYKAEVSAIQERLETLALSGEERRIEEVRAQGGVLLNEKKAELEQGKAELSSARKELDEGWAKLKDGEEELLAAEKKIKESEEELLKAESELAEAGRVLLEDEAQIDEAEEALLAAREQLFAGARELSSARDRLYEGWDELEAAKETARKKIMEELLPAVQEKLLTRAPDIYEQIQSWESVGKQALVLGGTAVTALQFMLFNGPSFNMETVLNYLTDAYEMVSADGFNLEEQLSEFRETSAPMLRLLATQLGINVNTVNTLNLIEDIVNETLFEVYSAPALFEEEIEKITSLVEGAKAWDVGYEQYLAATQDYIVGMGEYVYNMDAFTPIEAEYRKGVEEYEKGKRQYEEGLKALEEGKKEYEEGLKEYEKSKEQLEEGELAYEEGLQKVKDGEEQIASAEAELESVNSCKWLFLRVQENVGYAQVNANATSFERLESTFVLMFALIGALVIFATVSKIVDEQRSLVGTTKALGFFNREIFGKYLFFGAFATLFGAIVGMLLAKFIIQPMILSSQTSYFAFAIANPVFLFTPAALSALIAVLIATAAVFVACLNLLRAPAIQLMLPKVPGGKKKAKKERKGGSKPMKKGSLYSRLILSNMKTDFKRVLVTIVSVAGCCALIVIGITLRYGINGTTKMQYPGVADFDEIISFDEKNSLSAEEEIENILVSEKATYTALEDNFATFQLTDLELVRLYACDLESVNELFHLNDIQTGEPLAPKEGLVIQRRLAEIYSLKVGDEITLSLDGVKDLPFTVGGVYENYIGRGMYLDKTYFEKVTGETFTPNAFYVRWENEKSESAANAIAMVEGYEGSLAADSDRVYFEEATSVIDAIAIFFIAMAALMAFVVQLNLTSMYILQKKREITVMRINGFTTKEVKWYLLRETFFTTTIGIVFGIGVGALAGHQILCMLEQSIFHFVRSVCLPAFAVGAALTLLFTIVVNLIALRPVKNLKLIDVA